MFTVVLARRSHRARTAASNEDSTRCRTESNKHAAGAARGGEGQKSLPGQEWKRGGGGEGEVVGGGGGGGDGVTDLCHVPVPHSLLCEIDSQPFT